MKQDGKGRRLIVPGSPAWLAIRRRADFWTDQDVATLLMHFPDREKLADLLPHRTPVACSSKYARCGIGRPLRLWSSEECVALRKLYTVATIEQLVAAFPGRTLRGIRIKASKRKLRRPPPPIAPTGNIIIDTIRQRAKDLTLTMRDLDLEAGSRNYFKSTSMRRGFLRASAISSALKVLGGKLQIAWDE